MQVEDAVCSRTRIKILTLLSDGKQLNTSQIAQRVGTNYDNTHKHLEALEREGVLEMVPFGQRIRYYRFNMRSPRGHSVKTLLEAWKS